MDKVILVVTLLSEVLAIVICLHATLGKKLKPDKKLLLVITIGVLLLFLVNIKIISPICTVIVHIMIGMYGFREFKESGGRILQKYVISILICGLLEGIVSCMFLPFKENIESSIIAFASSVIVLIFICVLMPVIFKAGSIFDYENNKYMICYTILYAVSVVSVIVDYNLKGARLSIYIVGILAGLLLTYLLQIVLFHTKAEMEVKKIETELHEVYGSAYAELLSRVRRRQHDFSNQLTAIYSMHITANSLEELVKRQREYTDRLMDDCRYEDILTKCENPILTGYLYNRCLVVQNKGIEIDYDIRAEQAESVIKLHELIEIMGILLDNASESLEASKMQPLTIRFVFHESEEIIYLSVSNPSQYITCQQIEHMFIEGTSTKGKERGIGLARVKEIAKYYNIEIMAFNFEQEEKNWICFEMRIPKKQ